MAVTPNASFQTLSVFPQYGVRVLVDFRNYEFALGNGHVQITDGGRSNPYEEINIDRNLKVADSAALITQLESLQGSSPFNFRLYTGGNYKLYYCTEFSETQISAEFVNFRAKLTRHPDPQYDPVPATITEGNSPFPILNQPILWESTQESEAYPAMGEADYGVVTQRRARSLFTAQNSIMKSWQVSSANLLTETQFNTTETFLKQRRGRIPFRIQTVTAGADARSFICNQFEWELVTGSSAATARYRLAMVLREVYRAK